MYKINFARHIRRQGSDGNLYVTIPLIEERKYNLKEGDLVEVQIKKANIKNQNQKEKIST